MEIKAAELKECTETVVTDQDLTNQILNAISENSINLGAGNLRPDNNMDDEDEKKCT